MGWVRSLLSPLAVPWTRGDKAACRRVWSQAHPLHPSERDVRRSMHGLLREPQEWGWKDLTAPDSPKRCHNKLHSRVRSYPRLA